MSFALKLSQAINKYQNTLCLGIDPHDNLWPLYFDNRKQSLSFIETVSEWAHVVLELASSKVACVKFQSSMFESMGIDGIRLLSDLIKYAKKIGHMVILDAKRCDIKSSMTYYGKFAFEELQADALTVIPYMGIDVLDALRPWLSESCGAYVVWLSSNPSGRMIQQMRTEERNLFAVSLLNEFERFSEKHSLHDSWGLVLGATHLCSELGIKDELLQRYPLLLPGIGAQGAHISSKNEKLMVQSKNLFPMSRGLTGVGSSDECWRTCSSLSDYATMVENKLANYTKMFSLC